MQNPQKPIVTEEKTDGQAVWYVSTHIFSPTRISLFPICVLFEQTLFTSSMCGDDASRRNWMLSQAMAVFKIKFPFHHPS